MISLSRGRKVAYEFKNKIIICRNHAVPSFLENKKVSSFILITAHRPLQSKINHFYKSSDLHKLIACIIHLKIPISLKVCFYWFHNFSFVHLFICLFVSSPKITLPSIINEAMQFMFSFLDNMFNL